MSIDNRRNFFRSLIAEAISLVDEIKGTPQLRLNELKTIPDDILGGMVPVFNKAIPSRIEGGQLLVQGKSGKFRPYCQLTEREEYILTCFDGNHSITGICNSLMADFQLNQDAAYARVKNLFLQLAETGICHPAGAHQGKRN
jgi:hypothetical protein